MHLTEAQIAEFRTLCETKFGISLTDIEAEIEANDLMRLYELLAEPLPSEISNYDDDSSLDSTVRSAKPPAF